MGKLDHCRHCGSALIDGPSQTRSAVSTNFRVTVKNLPTRICPAGCPGFYWYWLDLGVEVIEMLHQSGHFSQPKGLWRRRHTCRPCGGELQRAGAREEFRFETLSRAGSTIELSVQGPTLACKNCYTVYLPAAAAGAERLHDELADVIGSAITTDLIHK